MTYSLEPAVTLPDERATTRDVGRYRALALLQVLDVATTWWILSQFSHRAEGNPVVAAFIERGGLDAAMVSLLVIKLAVVWVLYEKQSGVTLVSGIYGVVVFNNLLALVLLIW